MKAHRVASETVLFTNSRFEITNWAACPRNLKLFSSQAALADSRCIRESSHAFPDDSRTIRLGSWYIPANSRTSRFDGCDSPVNSQTIPAFG
ncbi:MAG TPA: hypothetical protein VIK35_11890 [Verrucomicrobiae bacterium]